MSSLEDKTKLLRSYRKSPEKMMRGKIPEVKFTDPSSLVGLIFISVFVFVAIFILVSSTSEILWAGFIPALLFSLPILYWAVIKTWFLTRVKGKRPSYKILDEISQGYQWLHPFIYRHHLVIPPVKKETNSVLKIDNSDPTTIRLWLGSSTGKLCALWHVTGMADKQQVVLNEQDAFKNILVLGGIGSGKTTQVMHPLLLQLFDQSCGGLIFDIKGDVKESVKKLACMHQGRLHMIGPMHTRINLLEGLSPEVAASFLKSSFLLSGRGSLDSFWLDTAGELCRNVLGMLSFLPAHYHLLGLYQYLFDEEIRASIDGEIYQLMEELKPDKYRLIRLYNQYYQHIFSNFDAKVQSGVKATIAQTLSTFNHPDLLDAFCVSSGEGLAIQSILKGDVFLVDMPLAQWGLGRKVAYMFIKLRFFNMMQNRQVLGMQGDESPVFFMCDEFQEIVSANKDGLSDLNFWDKSRSSKTIGIISAQSIASFHAAIGNRDLSYGIVKK